MKNNGQIIRGATIELKPHFIESGIGSVTVEVFPPPDATVIAFAKANGIADPTVRRFLKTMCHQKMIRQTNWKQVLLRRKGRKTV